MEGTKKLLDEIIIGDITLREGIEPLIEQCEILAQDDEKKFQKCLKESLFAGLYVVENLELPPGIKPVSHNISDNKFEFIKAKL